MKVKIILLSILMLVLCHAYLFGFNDALEAVNVEQGENNVVSRNALVSTYDGYYKAIKKHLYKMDKNFTIETTLKLDRELRKNKLEKWNKIFDKLDKDTRIMNMRYDTKGSYSITYDSHAKYVYAVKYDSSSKDLKRYDKFINKWNRKHIDSGMTDEEKVREIHDYIVSKCNYSYGDKGEKWFYKNIKNAASAKLGKYSIYTSLAMVFENGGVCAAYSNLFYDLAKKAGLEVKYIRGTITNSRRHAWNLVKVDGKWYHLDATWDDNNGGVKDYNYNFYLKSDKYMRENDHLWNPKSYPKCKESYEIEEDEDDSDDFEYEYEMDDSDDCE